MFRKRVLKREDESGASSRYGEELLSANWNPVIDLLARSCSATREHLTAPGRPEGEVDVDGFLNRVYTLGV